MSKKQGHFWTSQNLHRDEGGCFVFESSQAEKDALAPNDEGSLRQRKKRRNSLLHFDHHL